MMTRRPRQRRGGALCAAVLAALALTAIAAMRTRPATARVREQMPAGIHQTVARQPHIATTAADSARAPRREGPGAVSTTPPPDIKSTDINSGVYYGVKDYWNDVPSVKREVFYRRATGDVNTHWDEHVLKMHGGVPFRRALVINAGNGWVEREMMDKGIVLSAVGTDFMQSFVDEANAKTAASGYNATYVQHDINVDKLPVGDFDLVLNFAAAHHVARLDFVFQQLHDLLPDDGWFVSMDYVGPHRNQYPDRLWAEIQRVNALLPPHVQQSLAYPHLPTMLATDPSEAQHSELIMETMRRYFFVDVFRPLGGAVAYPILTHNAKLHALPYDSTQSAVDQVMEADAAWLAADPGRTFFAFVVARPLKAGVPNERYRDLLLRRELEVEAAGTKSTYYTPTRAAAGA